MARKSSKVKSTGKNKKTTTNPKIKSHSVKRNSKLVGSRPDVASSTSLEVQGTPKPVISKIPNNVTNVVYNTDHAGIPLSLSELANTKSTLCTVTADGLFEKGKATLRISEDSHISCNKTQEINLEQNGRIFTYVRTLIGTIEKPKKL